MSTKRECKVRKRNGTGKRVDCDEKDTNVS
jgi:hypothetical protein